MADDPLELDTRILAHTAPGVDPPSNQIEVVQRLPLRWRA